MAAAGAGGAGATGGAPQALVRRGDFPLGNAIVRPSLLSVEGPAGARRAEPRVMEVLMAFVDAGDKVLSRDDLVRECWDGRIVGEDAIHRVIGELRKLVRETGASFAIETIPRVGYRLNGGAVAPVPAELLPIEPSRAVLAPTRRAVLAGAVVAAGALAAGGWAILRPRPDPRFEALMAQGRDALRTGVPGANVVAARLFGQAAALDPRSAPAWGLLALSTTGVGDETSPPFTGQAIRTAEDAAGRARALDPREPNAMLAMALLQSRLDDWVTTEDKFRQIIDTAPDHVPALQNLVFLLQGVGRSAASWDFNERALAIEPLSPSAQTRRGLKHWIFGRIGEADRVIDRALELWPRQPWAWNARLLIYAFTDRPRAALALIEDVRSRPPNLPAPMIAVWQACLKAMESRQAADIAVARGLVLRAAPQSPGIAAYGVMQLAGMGEVDAAYAVANGFLVKRGKLVVQGPSAPEETLDRSPVWYRTQWVFLPATAPLRSDPRFAGLCEEIGLTSYWQQRGIGPDPFQRGSLPA